jgi:D-sedoheptulose 7-phosphate isomerase
MTSENNLVEAYFDHYAQQASVVPKVELERMADIIWDASVSGGTVYVFGNGACAALAAHMATDLSKGTAVALGAAGEALKQPRIRILSLSDNTALLTAYGNDFGYEYVYVEQLRCLLQAGDVVMALSGSGGSPNVLHALDYAKAVGVHRLGLTGRQDSAPKLVSRCDIAVQAPSSMMEHIEDWHVIYNHVLALLLRARLRAYVDSETGVNSETDGR